MSGAGAVRIAIRVPWLCRCAGGGQEPVVLSLPLFLSALHNFSVTCFLTGLLIYPAIDLL